ncbi:MAG: hypothetical protein PUF12_07495, partial [Thermoflexaceae bacterium]|nr:hypothetical protein [Thermoflexaceae bacterium]
MGLPLRSEIDSRYKWKIEDLYATDELWEKEFETVSSKVSKEPSYKGRLAESEEILYAALQESDELEAAVEKLYVYANQKYYEDTANARYQGYAGQVQGLMTQFYAVYSYQEPEILAMSEEVLKACIESQGEIKLFSQYLKNILRQKQHILSEELENVMANASDMAQGAKDIFSSFNNADIRFGTIKGSDGEEIEVTHGKYSLLMENKDRRVRKDAFKAIYSA